MLANKNYICITLYFCIPIGTIEALLVICKRILG